MTRCRYHGAALGRMSAVRSIAPGQAFGLEPYHFEKVTKGVETGAPGHVGQIVRQRRNVAGDFASASVFLFGLKHGRSVAGKGRMMRNGLPK